MSEKDTELITPIVASKRFGFNYKSLPLKLRKSLLFHFSDDGKYINLDKLNNFFANHKSIIELQTEVVNLTGVKPWSFNSRVKEILENIGVEITIIVQKLECYFITNVGYEKALEFYKAFTKHPTRNLFTREEISKELQLPNTPSIMEAILAEYGIVAYIKTNRAQYFHRDQIEKLKEIQKTEIDCMVTNYISINEITSKLGYNKSTVLTWIYNNEIESIDPPLITKIKNGKVDFKGRSKYIPVDDGNKYFQEVELRKQFDELISLYNPTLDAVETYKQLLIFYDKQFNEFGRLTDKYWDRFAYKKINETRNKDISGFVHSYALQKGFLIDVINASNKEIFQLTTKEINFSLLSESVPYTYATTYYAFIRSLHEGVVAEGGESPFQMDKLRSPKKDKKQNKSEKIKEIYDPEVYIDLLNYASDLEVHLNKAFDDSKVQGTSNYRFYANMWLYIILNLTNSWRHGDIIEFPRLELEMYIDKDLDWLLNNPISKEDAKVIKAYYENKLYIHNKTVETRYLIVNDQLTLPFANAVLICEFIQRKTNDFSPFVFDFGNKQNKPSLIVEKNYLKSFKHKRFKLENRKMNWTVITLATNVISKITGRNSLEISKALRNHSTSEITNIYIQLPEKYIEFLATQLFELGSFGYIYDGMAKLLLEEDPKMVQTENALLIKNTFSSPQLIESISYHLNTLNKERNHVLNVLKNQSKDEILEKMDLIKFGLLPAKKDGFQCLLGEARNCPKKTNDCDKCIFSIPSRFALNSLALDLNKVIEDMEQGFLQTIHEAEKVRLANVLFTQLQFLKIAIDKFGRSVVDQFIPEGLSKVNERLSKLPSTKALVSIEVKEWLTEEEIY